MKSKLSLRFDLLFDLSLLTFCALILSEGVLMIVLRLELPRQLEDVAVSYIKPLHSEFIHSENFLNWMEESSRGEPKEKNLQPVLDSFMKKNGIGERWANLSIEAMPSTLRDDTLKTIRGKFFLFIPTIYEYVYQTRVNDHLALAYHWSLRPLHATLTHFKSEVFFLTALIASILVLLGYFFLFRKNILIPIQNLNVVSKAYLQENWSQRCAVERKDELGNIAEALNEMASNIQEKEKKLMLTIDSLKKANEEIELAQNEQLQIEKLASIGRLAAGVAHEVGNPLGAIAGYVDILRTAMKKLGNADPQDVELCDRIESETNRISRIIRALLQQARPTKDRIKAVRLKPVAVRSVQLAQIPADIDVSYDFEDENAEVLAEEDQLVQVVLNLLVNSKHAIELKKNSEQGRLKIRCVLRKLPFYRADANELDSSVVRSLKPENYWVLSIEDNGVGISEGDQKKLFEPFFSTKAPGKGTGLGLYVTKSIVESFRGAIVCRSALNYGTSFSIFLPKGRPIVL